MVGGVVVGGVGEGVVEVGVVLLFGCVDVLLPSYVVVWLF